MKTLFSTILITVLVLGVVLAVSPGRADAWYRGPAVGFSLVLPPFGVSIGAPYYYPASVYVAPPYPFYGRAYYRPYYGYSPYYGGYGYGYRYWGHGGWRGGWDGRGHGHWGHGGWRGDRDDRGHGHWRR